MRYTTCFASLQAVGHKDHTRSSPERPTIPAISSLTDFSACVIRGRTIGLSLAGPPSSEQSQPPLANSIVQHEHEPNRRRQSFHPTSPRREKMHCADSPRFMPPIAGWCGSSAAQWTRERTSRTSRFSSKWPLRVRMGPTGISLPPWLEAEGLEALALLARPDGHRVAGTGQRPSSPGGQPQRTPVLEPGQASPSRVSSAQLHGPPARGHATHRAAAAPCRIPPLQLARCLARGRNRGSAAGGWRVRDGCAGGVRARRDGRIGGGKRVAEVGQAE